MNVVAEIQRINDLELEKGLTHTPGSWHAKYRDSAWVYAGNLPLALTEGDVLCVLSQFGEIDDIHLVREPDSGKSRGFAFVKYEDARSCVLAVDNLTGSQVLDRTLRIDHVEKYRLPKHVREREDNEKDEDGDGGAGASRGVAEAGHAYEGQELASSYDIHSGQDLFAAPTDEGAEATRHSAGDCKGTEKDERRRRKELRAQKRREKEEHRRRKEERKRRKHEKRRSSRSRDRRD